MLAEFTLDNKVLNSSFNFRHSEVSFEALGLIVKEILSFNVLSWDVIELKRVSYMLGIGFKVRFTPCRSILSFLGFVTASLCNIF